MAFESQNPQIEPFTDWEDLNPGDLNVMISFVSAVERFSVMETRNDSIDEQSRPPDHNDEDEAMGDIAPKPATNWEDLDPNDPDAMHSSRESEAEDVKAMPDIASEVSESNRQDSSLENDSDVEGLCGFWIIEDDKPSNPLCEVAPGWISPSVEAPAPHSNVTVSAKDRIAVPSKGTEEYFQHFAQAEHYAEATQFFDLEVRDGKMQFQNPFNQPDPSFFGEWEFGSEGERQSPGRRRSSFIYEEPPQGLRREVRAIQDFPKPLEVKKRNLLTDEEIVMNSSGGVVGTRPLPTGFDHIPWENQTGNPAVKKGKNRRLCKTNLVGFIRRQLCGSVNDDQ